ncbi:unnamed protein product [Trichogramma brassicae]|uniref:Osiris 7 n=1 Tax=Trichogramma brassicae TaxID=86971 RepID=A0A6H5HZG9_9HYME|nr:unnamed protein product [Trichogramma brassicae]
MFAKTWMIVACCCLASRTWALPAASNDEKIANGNDLMSSIYADCVKKESLSCIKYKVFAFVDRMLADKEDISLSEGITVVKTTQTNIEEGAPRSIDSTDLETLLFDRLGRFLRTHSIKVDLKGSDILGAIESTARSFDGSSAADDSSAAVEGRKKKKTQKMMGPIMMAMAMKAAALLPLSLGFIALIAGKALLIGKIALVISTIIGLKKLLSTEKHVTYEVVQHPHHSSSHSVSSHDDSGPHGGGGFSASAPSGGDFGGYGGGSGSGGHGGGWSRSFAQDLAYGAQKPAASGSGSASIVVPSA